MAAYSDLHRRMLWGVLLLALLLRLGWVLTRDSSASSIDALPDQREYLSLADNLIHGRGLGFYDPRFQEWLVAYRMPGYPLLLAACGSSLPVIRIVQALLDTSTVWAVWLLAMRCMPIVSKSAVTSESFAPLVAAVLVAVNPFLIYFSGLILSETIFVSLLIWGMLLLTRPAFASQTGGRILLALSVLVRPSALLLPLILSAVSPRIWRIVNVLGQNSRQATTYHKTWNWRSIAVSTAWMGAWIVVFCLPWAIRNHRSDVLGRWVFLTTNGGVTAYDGMNPDADGSSNQSFLRGMPELRKLDEVSRSDYLQHLAQQYAKSHPSRAIALTCLKILRTWSPVPLSDSFGGWGYRAVAFSYSGVLDVMVVAGLIRGRLPRVCKVLLLAPAIYLTGVHALSVGSLRYRLPAEPPMAILGASVLVSGVGKRVASTPG